MDATYIHLTINKMISMNRRYQTVLAVIRDVGGLMGAVNIATAVHRLGRLVREVRKSAEYGERIQDRLYSNRQYQYLLQRVVEVHDAFTPRSLANVLWGLAAIGRTKNKELIDVLMRKLLTMDLAEVKTQELSNVLWSMATLGVDDHPTVMDKLLDSACERIDECVPQAVSNMIWACATLRHHHPNFSQAVAASAAPRLSSFQSQTLANTLWAYSVLGLYPKSLFNAAADEIVRRLELVNSNEYRGISGPEKSSTSSRSNSSGTRNTNNKNNGDDNTATTRSPAQHYRRPDLGTQNAPFTEFRAQEISNILIAFARGCIIHPKLLQCIEAELCRTVQVHDSADGQPYKVQRLKVFTPQALANTLWAFATLRWYPARLLPSITEAIGGTVAKMTAQEVSNCLWSYARFAYHPGRVMAMFLSVMERRVDEFEGQGCTNSLWALAVLKATHSGAFVDLLQRYVELEQSRTEFGELQYNQILQAVLLAQFEARGGRVAWRPEVDLPETTVDRALKAWASQQMSTQLSGFHLDVSEGLTRLGIPHILEHLVARDLLSIDIAVVQEDHMLAIEVDGPFHFPVNARTPLGHTMIRRRLLRAAGWTVISIPWYEWFSMHTWDERLSYLTLMLSKADDRFAHQLKPAGAKELLSTNFAPGPGPVNASAGSGKDGDTASVNDTNEVDDTTSTTTAANASPTYDDTDGPVLSYYGGANGGALEVDNGLWAVLNRSNVMLTSGAVRRLQSMGLGDIVRDVKERRKSWRARNVGGGARNSTAATDDDDDDDYDEDVLRDASLYYDPSDPQLMPKPRLPPYGAQSSSSSWGQGQEGGSGRRRARRHERYAPQRGDTAATDEDERGEREPKRPERFNPRFVTDGESNWGFYPPAEEALKAVERKSRKERNDDRKYRASYYKGKDGGAQAEAMFRKVLHDTRTSSTTGVVVERGQKSENGGDKNVRDVEEEDESY